MATKTRVVLLFAILLVAAGGYDFVTARAHVLELQKLVSSYVVPNMHVRGNEYRVDNGIVYRIKNETHTEVSSVRIKFLVLQLSYVSILLRAHPSFSLSGTDTGKLREASSVYKAYGAYITSRYTPAIRKEFAPLFDTEFLEAMADLEDTRRALVMHPRDELLPAYDRSLRKTIFSAEKVSKKFLAHYSDAQTAEPDNVFHTFDGIMNFAFLTRTLSNIRDTIDNSGADFSARIACTPSTSQNCDFPVNIVQGTELLKTEPIPASVRFFQSAFIHAIPQKADALHKGEMIALKHDMCLQKDTPTFYTFYTRTVTREAIPSTQRDTLVPLNDIHFFDATLNTFPNISLEWPQSLPEDQPFLWERPVTSYMCAAGFDTYARVHTLYDIAHLIKKYQFFSRIPENNRVDRTHAVALEKNIVESPVVASDALDAYITLINQLIQGGDRWVYEYLKDDLYVLYTVANMYQENSGSYDQTILHGVNTTILDFAKNGELPQIDRVTASHARPQLLLATFNSSVTPVRATWTAPAVLDLKNFYMTSYLSDTRVQQAYPYSRLIEILSDQTLTF